MGFAILHRIAPVRTWRSLLNKFATPKVSYSRTLFTPLPEKRCSNWRGLNGHEARPCTCEFFKELARRSCFSSVPKANARTLFIVPVQEKKVGDQYVCN